MLHVAVQSQLGASLSSLHGGLRSSDRQAFLVAVETRAHHPSPLVVDQKIQLLICRAHLNVCIRSIIRCGSCCYVVFERNMPTRNNQKPYFQDVGNFFVGRGVVWVTIERLYTNQPAMSSITKYAVARNKKPVDLVDRLIDARGKSIVRGGPALKASQSYTAAFGLAVVRSFEDCQVERSNFTREAAVEILQPRPLQDIFVGGARLEMWEGADVESALSVFDGCSEV